MRKWVIPYTVSLVFLFLKVRTEILYCSITDYKTLDQAHTLSAVPPRQSLVENQFFYVIPTITNLSDFILAVLGDSIQSELETLKNSFFRVRLNLERAWDDRLKPVPQYS